MRTLKAGGTRIATALAIALHFASPDLAGATPITRTFDFSGSDFTCVASCPPPVDTVIGRATLTFDPAGGDVFNVTAGIVLERLNVSLGSAIAFNYRPATDLLAIGGISAGVLGLTEGTNDFYVSLVGASTESPAFVGLNYRQQASCTGNLPCIASTGLVTAVPEPGALLLLGLGLAGLAAAGRWRSRL